MHIWVPTSYVQLAALAAVVTAVVTIKVNDDILPSIGQTQYLCPADPIPLMPTVTKALPETASDLFCPYIGFLAIIHYSFK